MDIYKSPLNPTDAWVGPPAANVISGYSALANPDKDCDPGTKNLTDMYTGVTDWTTKAPDTTAQVMPYPRDKCFYTGTCTKFGTGPFDGTHWDRDTYCKVNHPPSGADCPDLVTTGLKETKTRYGMYRAEIEQTRTGGTKMPNNSLDPGKTGNGQAHACYKGFGWDEIPAGPDVREPGFDPTTGVQDRRVITTAVVNCLEQDMNGRKNIKIAAWVLMFLTEPAGYEVPDALIPSGMDTKFFDNQNMFLEVIRQIDVNQDKAIAHEIVQLYR
jgi:hypothetical protein